jgi:hypothetical protein
MVEFLLRMLSAFSFHGERPGFLDEDQSPASLRHPGSQVHKGLMPTRAWDRSRWFEKILRKFLA